MDESETYMNFAKTNSGILRKASRDILSSTYSELKTGKEQPLSNKEQDPPVASGRGELPITVQTEGMNSTYSVLNLRKDEPLIHEYEDPPIASGPAELSVTAQAGAHDQESKLKIGKRLHCLICLLCLVTFALIVTVTAFSIHVSQIRQSQTTLDRNCHELNSTLQSEINEMETKYKAVNETKAQICELLTSRRGPHKQKSKENIGNRAYHKICLLCLVTSILVAIVAGLSIHVSQTRQSLIDSDRNYRRLWEQHKEMNRSQRQCQQRVREFNSTVKSRTSENSCLDLSQRNCLKNISVLNNNLSKLENNITVLNSDLSELNRTQIDLRHQFQQLKTKYRTISENKAQICQYFTSRRGQTCPQYWHRNKDRCYFISTWGKSYDEAREYCSDLDARLLEINSKEEKDFVSSSIGYADRSYWIGKCRDGNVASYLLYEMSQGSPTCSKCDSYGWIYNCKSKYEFICEKSAYLYPDIPEEIQDLCQQPDGTTSIK
ncbi:uncharacterized protein [Mobula birostris]|uniref:uncharacterized protein isoform X1 n=1 Tax=Mobula birostris TaxID=1983395 RepID=UPI003B28C923